MNTPNQTHDEIDLKNSLNNKIISCWQQGIFDSFIGVDKANIHYAKFIQNQPHNKDDISPSIVLVPGRCESYLKYQELTFDLVSKGYSVFIIDHRGQGLSERLLKNPHKGYVKKFQDYVDDLRYFVEEVVPRDCIEKPYLLAHSMGGAIAVRFMQDAPNAIKAAVISSPMIGFHSGFLPITVAKSMMKALATFNKRVSKNSWYFLGQKDYAPSTFAKNNLTHSKSRYDAFVDLYHKNADIQLGGVTVHWLQESIEAQEEIFMKLSQLTAPTLLIQSGKDDIVCPKAQDDFCRQLHAIHPQSCPNGKPLRIENAYHELFFELDEMRNPAINRAVDWFRDHK